MYIQLTENDRTVLSYESRGDTVSRVGEVSEWEYHQGTPQTILVVQDRAHDTYLVLYANNEERDANKWHLMWRDDKSDKAMAYFVDYISDLEIERQITDANKPHITAAQK